MRHKSESFYLAMETKQSNTEPINTAFTRSVAESRSPSHFWNLLWDSTPGNPEFKVSFLNNDKAFSKSQNN